ELPRLWRNLSVDATLKVFSSTLSTTVPSLRRNQLCPALIHLRDSCLPSGYSNIVYSIPLTSISSNSFIRCVSLFCITRSSCFAGIRSIGHLFLRNRERVAGWY